MKKYIVILSVFALCACAKELTPEKEDLSIGGEILTARIVNTKVNINDLGKFSWTEGDQIAIHRSVNGYETATLSEDGTFSVHLSEGEARDGYAIYPAVAADENASEASNLSVNLPNAYSIPKTGMGDYTPLPMVAVNDPGSEDVYFHHLGGVFRLDLINLPFETQKIAFNLGKRITGSFPVEGLDSDTPYISLPEEQGEDIVFSLKSYIASSDGIIINIPVPVGTYDILSYKIYDRYGNFMGENSEEIDITVARADGFEWTQDLTIDVSRIPLCLKMAELGELTITNPLLLTMEFSHDNVAWESFNVPEKKFILKKGDCVYLRGENATYSTGNNNYTNISSNKTCYVYGNIMSLITPDPDDFSQLKTLTASYTFNSLFYDSYHYGSTAVIVNHPTMDLILPATTLSSHCYRRLFYNTSFDRISLPATELAEYCYEQMFGNVKVPIEIETLPAMTLAPNCYDSMFEGSVIQKAPLLPATTLASYCYNEMFYGCKSLVTPPVIQATTLAQCSCSYMFRNCTALVTAPALPATELDSQCYYYMFAGCTSLVNAPELPATIITHTTTEGRDWRMCYDGMFSGCTALVTAPALPSPSLTDLCYRSMFEGCTALVNAPELSVTDLAGGCYQSMFKNCTSLVNAPELPATRAFNQCYQNMFEGCTALVNAPQLPATEVYTECYDCMFKGCTALVNAPELPALKMDFRCYKEMFSGCTSLVTAPELPATELGNNCYGNMFEGCTSLETAPELPALELWGSCYVNMFKGCTSLNYVKAMFTSLNEYAESVSACVSGWLTDVAASGTFVRNAAATYDLSEIGLPSGWTSTETE